MSTSRRGYSSALVTGASSGIGEALARTLAARGCDLVLTARRRDRLEALATELRDEHGVRVEVLAADLADPAQLSSVVQRAADQQVPIDLLVNNAGRTPQPIGPLSRMEPAGEQEKIAVNVMALMLLTQAVLPGMQARGHGGVLNVSSFASFVPQPNAAVYAATKAFVTSFSESVHSEAARHGVHVTVLAPGFTRRGDAVERGGMQRRRMPQFLWLDRDEVALAALDAVTRGDAVCVPGAPYRALALLARLAPRPFVRRFFNALWNPRQRPSTAPSPGAMTGPAS
jgi:short-subunit dehydrogenase